MLWFSIEIWLLTCCTGFTEWYDKFRWFYNNPSDGTPLCFVRRRPSSLCRLVASIIWRFADALSNPWDQEGGKIDLAKKAHTKQHCLKRDGMLAYLVFGHALMQDVSGWWVSWPLNKERQNGLKSIILLLKCFVFSEQLSVYCEEATFGNKLCM